MLLNIVWFEPLIRATPKQAPSAEVPVGNVSLAFRGGDGGESNFTAFMAHFGQAALLELLPEFLTADNIICPIGKDFFKTYSCSTNNASELTNGECTGAKRDSFLYSVAMSNPTTPVIDGSFIYSTSESHLQTLRTHSKGMLSVDRDNMPLKNSEGVPLSAPPRPARFGEHKGLERVEELYAVGSPEANQNAPLLTISILMHRYHNHVAQKIANQNSSLDDETVFQIARKWVVASWQNVIVNEYFEHLFGELPKYEEHRPTVNPQISVEFLAVAPVVKTMVPFGYLASDCVQTKQHSLCQEWWDAANSIPMPRDFDLIVRGLISQPAEPIDSFFSAALTDFLFGGLSDSQRDLIAITLQRGRDMGAPSYNAARTQFGLAPIDRWDEFAFIRTHVDDVSTDFDPMSVREPGEGNLAIELLQQHNQTVGAPRISFQSQISNVRKMEHQLSILERLYSEHNASLDDVDLLVGVLLEMQNGTFGPVGRAIFREQFQRIRDGDRFWFENDPFFTDADRQKIRETGFSDIVTATTSEALHLDGQNVFLIDKSTCILRQQIDTTVCGAYHSYDFFTGSAGPYIVSVTAILLTPIVCLAIIYCISKCKKSSLQVPFYGGVIRKRRSEYGTMAALDTFIAFEKTSPTTRRRVRIDLSVPSVVSVYSRDGSLLRSIKYDLNEERVPKVVRGMTEKAKGPREYLVLVEIGWEYDLVVSFDDLFTRTKFIKALETKLAVSGILPDKEPKILTDKQLLHRATFLKDRKETLKLFFESAFSEIMHGKLPKSARMEEARTLKINISEFADSLQLRPKSHFVKKMFEIADAENRGVISYGEFVAVLGLLYKGKFEEKMAFLFSMYDENQDGKLTQHELRHMITSIYDVVGMRDPQQQNRSSIDMTNALLSRFSLNDMGVQDFVHMMHGNRQSFLQRSEIFGLGGEEKSPSFSPSSSELELTTVPAEKVHRLSKPCTLVERLSRTTEIYRRQIAISFLIAAMSLVIFVKVFFDFADFTEQKTQRRVMGNWLAAAKGSGAAIWFTLGLIFLSVCKHVLTFLNSTILANFIPFHSSVDFHKFVAWLMYFYAAVHVFSHLVNFYELSTQPPEVIECVYPKYLFASDYLPTFSWYLFRTRVGLTGFLVTVLMMVMLVFALPFVRALTFRAFWITHHLYPAVVVLLIVHGCMGNFKLPQFYLMVVIPLAIYALDWVFHLKAKGSKVAVAKATALPSEVTHLSLELPPTFSYTSGQWVRICCPDISSHEYHPFTIASAPCQGRQMDLYIRAVGPWTKALRKMVAEGGEVPRIIMHGPYGSVHQDWYRFETVVLVGSGIGVTPHASVLRDLVFKAKMGGVTTKKVHFLWLSRNHKHFEWFIDILREVESQDPDGVISIDIYVTQLIKDYDVRTMMLYMCENNFHKIAGKSIFTGLKARILFHRPNFAMYFRKVCAASPTASRVGVFTCGGKPVVASVARACTEVNNSGTKGPLLVAHEEVF